MKFESIELMNFGAFKHQIINLEDVTSGTICGKNGAGKSTAFVDAVLWCLFGKCRIHQDQMIRLGETDMSVSLWFSLDGSRYEVRRSRSIRTKAGKSDIKLFIFSEGVGWVPLDKTVKELLQADYDVCTSTNILIQGQFDQVSKADPSKRQALLSEILRIAKYSDYATESRRRGSKAEGQLIAEAGKIEGCRNDVLRYQAAVTILNEAEEGLTIINGFMSEVKLKQEALIKEQATIEATLNAMPEVDLIALDNAVEGISKASDYLQERIRNTTALAERATELEGIKQQAEALEVSRVAAMAERTEAEAVQREADQALEEAQAKQLELQAELSKFSTQQATLNAEIKALRSTIAEYEATLKGDEDKAGLVAKLQKVEREQAEAKVAIQEAEKRLTEYRKTFEEDSKKYHEIEVSLSQEKSTHAQDTMMRDAWIKAYNADTEKLRESIKKAEAQAELLKTVPCGEDLQRRCGFTKEAAKANDGLLKLHADLSMRETDQGKLELKFGEGAVISGKEVKRLEDWLKGFIWSTTEEERGRLQASINNLKYKADEREAEIATIRKSLPDSSSIAKAHAELPNARLNLEGRELALGETSKAIEKTKSNIEALGISGKRAHRVLVSSLVERVSTKIRTIEDQQANQRALLADLPKVQHAIEVLPGLKDEANRKADELERARQAVKDANAQIAKKRELGGKLNEVKESLSLVSIQGEAYISKANKLQADKATAQATINQTCEAESKMQEIEKQVQWLRDEVQHYAWLTEAYKRVPYLILENALPVLEHEANRILGMINSSGMHIRIETQRALKTRDALVDTIDFIVQDQKGERPYEAFSGGEKMRLDLALRLGLSKLIATRSGSKIQTLIIDEAFAPLDADGVSQMRKCLAMLEQEYPLVLVVTHDEELKGTLGRQIVVTPGVNGSTVEVLA